jgi:hypothetical protein
VERQFQILGFDRVFEPGADLNAAIELIGADTDAKGR